MVLKSFLGHTAGGSCLYLSQILKVSRALDRLLYHVIHVWPILQNELYDRSFISAISAQRYRVHEGLMLKNKRGRGGRKGG